MGQDSTIDSTTPLLNQQATAPPAYLPPSHNPDNEDHDPFANVPPELQQDCEDVRSELHRLGITLAHKARVCLVLDISRSMQNPNQFFRNTFLKKPGPINELLKKAIAVTMAFDNDQKLEIFPFGTNASSQPFIATPYDYEQVILRDILKNNPKDTMQADTNYARAMKAVRQCYFEESRTQHINASASTPVFMIMVTDGDHNQDQLEAKAQFRASSFQPIFCKIIALKGKPQNGQAPVDFNFLKAIDDAPTFDNPGRTKLDECNFIDNADFIELDDPSQLTTEDLLKEYPQWVLQAREKGLITVDPQLNTQIVNAGKVAAGRIGENKRGCCTIL